MEHVQLSPTAKGKIMALRPIGGRGNPPMKIRPNESDQTYFPRQTWVRRGSELHAASRQLDETSYGQETVEQIAESCRFIALDMVRDIMPTTDQNTFVVYDQNRELYFVHNAEALREEITVGEHLRQQFIKNVRAVFEAFQQ